MICRRAAHLASVSAEVSGHAMLDRKSDVAHTETVPRTGLRSGTLENHVPLSQLLQRAWRRSVPGLTANSPLFPLQQSLETRFYRAESQFPIKPEGTRVDRLLVMMTELIGIH